MVVDIDVDNTGFVADVGGAVVAVALDKLDTGTAAGKGTDKGCGCDCDCGWRLVEGDKLRRTGAQHRCDQMCADELSLAVLDDDVMAARLYCAAVLSVEACDGLAQNGRLNDWTALFGMRRHWSDVDACGLTSVHL